MIGHDPDICGIADYAIDLCLGCMAAKRKSDAKAIAKSMDDARKRVNDYVKARTGNRKSVAKRRYGGR